GGRWVALFCPRRTTRRPHAGRVTHLRLWRRLPPLPREPLAPSAGRVAAQQRIETRVTGSRYALSVLLDQQEVCSPPAEGGGDERDDALEHPGVVVDAQLIGHCDENRIGLLDGRVAGELLDERIRFPDVAAAEARQAALEIADLVFAFRL